MSFITISPDKETALAEYFGLRESPSLGHRLSVYTDGSKTAGGTGAAWALFDSGASDGALGLPAPDTWNIVEVEPFAILRALRQLGDMGAADAMIIWCWVTGRS
ncbi:hypothetical protein L873DRAFT_1845436 [Choiromyces venosus 120613-1]|uniref:RNase H type-1 domain-containing protein n=1 Tax=Choiromyces venosus 120613-1 TaxID=1336337 RepID=A0A3N4JDG8_9PEZI|nr:hypothetical protein L873DRAFT_1845436 [Choiromyces venosus 120613-1]